MADRPLRLLVVDDDEIDRMSVRRSLSAAAPRPEIVECGDGESALERLGQAAFDCVLLDVRMPGQTGLEVLRALRERQLTVPVIMLTGFGDEETAVECMKAGASDYFAKAALDGERLRGSLSAAVRLHQAQEQARRAGRELERHAAQLRELAAAAAELNAPLSEEALRRKLADAARRIVGAEEASVDILPAGAAQKAAPRQPDGGLSAPLRGQAGELLGVVRLSGRDFDGHDQSLLAQLANLAAIALINGRLLRRADAATRLREDMIAVVSHDLRNPLSTIVMCTRILLETLPGLDAGAKEKIARIDRSAEHMRQLISDLLDLTRIEGNQLKLELHEVPSHALVEDSVEPLRPLAQAKNIQLGVEVAPALEVIRCDPARIRQVFSNIVGNALKFTPAGGSVLVRAEPRPQSVRFSVADDGPGIPPEFQALIFDRYWQAPATASQGAGLGLFIAKGIVEAHGGRISVESREGRGSVFSFVIPAA